MVNNVSPTLHPAEDYNLLRQEALVYIQKLSGKLWTDYNTHDPGITMMEVLAFAVADLGFRTGHPIADILAPGSPQEQEIKQFFTLAEIATARPWSVTDYRKLLIDLPQIANAWLTPSTTQEVHLCWNAIDREYELHDTSVVGLEDVRLRGLYEVAIRFEEDPDFGDLNDNSIRFWADIAQPNAPVATEIEIEFPFESRLPKRLRKLDEAAINRLTLSANNIGPIPGETLAWYANLVFPPFGPESNLDTFQQEFRVEIRLLQPQGLLLHTASIKTQLTDSAWWKTILRDRYLPRQNRKEAHLATVRTALHGHRNLGEDFYAIVPMDLQEVAVSMDLEVRVGTDLEATEVAVYDAIQQYLDPPLRFYSLAEMLEKGHSTDQIFDGPLLKNGFIDREELLALPRRTAVYGSDLIQLIMAIEGVVAVRQLRMGNRIAADSVADNVADSLRLTEPGRFQPTCDARRSKIRFCHRTQPAADQPDKNIVVQRFRASVQGNVPYKGIHAERDIAAPLGRVRNLSGYATVQAEFPQAWGIGPYGLPANASTERIQQAQQLKAFLLFFEQMMVNYLAQLQNVKQLLAVETAGQAPTYFSNIVQAIPDLRDLLVDAGGFPESLQKHMEDATTLADRRNRALDHLLARFNTSMVEYATLSWQLKLPENPDHWIDAKAQFLQQFPRLTAHRGGAIDLSQRSEHCLEVPGYLRRVFGLLGWNVPDAFRLRSGEGQDAGKYFLQIVDVAEKALFQTVPLALEVEPFKKIRDILDLLMGPNPFKVAAARLELRATNNELQGTTVPFANTTEEKGLRESLVQIASQLDFALQTLVVEHILLRPATTSFPGASLLSTRTSPLEAFDVIDPWSFRVSIIFPPFQQVDAFKHEAWRRHVQKTIREELPSHLYVEFFWLSDTQYETTARAHRDWITATFQWLTAGVSMHAAAQKMSLTMNRLLNRFGAQYAPIVPKRKTQYETDEVITTPYDPDGTIVKAWLYNNHALAYDYPWVSSYNEIRSEAQLPAIPGVYLDQFTGEIYVKDKLLLTDFAPKLIEIITMNQAGGVTFHGLSLSMLGDQPATATILEKFDQNYAANEFLVNVEDPDSEIVLASLAEGTLVPNGTTLSPVTGDVTITNIVNFRKAITSPSLSISVAISIRNAEGLTQIVRATGKAYKSPRPVQRFTLGGPIAQLQSDSNFYTIQPLEPSHTIRQVAALPSNAAWGLQTTLGTPARGVTFQIQSFATFKAKVGEFGSGSVPVEVFIGNHRLALELPYAFGADRGAQLTMATLPTEAHYQDGTSIGTITDPDNGIASFRITATNPPNGMLPGLPPNDGPLYRPFDIALDQQRVLNIKVGRRTDFLDFVSKYFIVNSYANGGNAYFAMAIETTDMNGGVSTLEPQIYFTTPAAIVVDTEAQWIAGLLSGTLTEFAGVTIGTLLDANGGIPNAPMVNQTITAATWLSSSGLQFIKSTSAPFSWTLKVGIPTTFANFSKGFTLNQGKTQSSLTFAINSIDAINEQSTTNVTLTVRDTPPTWLRNTKFANPIALKDVVPSLDWLFTITDTVDGGVRTVRDAVGSNWISTGTLGWRLPNMPPDTLAIANLSNFLRDYPLRASKNTGLGRYELNIQVIVTDEHGFEAALALPLYFRLDEGAAWSPLHVSGTLYSYVTAPNFVANPVIGEISDSDGGITLTPTIVTPSQFVLSQAGLIFSPIGTSPNIRQQLKIQNFATFKNWVKALQPKDSLGGFVNFEMTVRVTDSVNQSTTVAIKMQVLNTAPTSRPNPAINGKLVPMGVKNGHWLFEFTDDVDLGIKSLDLHPDSGTLAAWGLKQDLVTVPGKGGLVVEFENTFRTKFKNTPKTTDGPLVQAILIKVVVTDMLGFSNTLTVDLRLKVDQTASWTQLVFKNKITFYISGRVIGTLSDANGGVKSVAMNNGNAGLQFVPNILDASKQDLVVGEVTAFRSLFPTNNTGQDLLFTLSATSTDNEGGVTEHLIPIIVQAYQQVSSAQIMPSPGLVTTKRFYQFVPGFKLGAISGDADWTATISTLTKNPTLAGSAIGISYNSNTTEFEVTVANTESFRAMVITDSVPSGDKWAYTLILNVTDANSQTTQVSLPIQVLDNPATLTLPTLPTLSGCVSGTTIAKIEEPMDAGIKEFRFQSLPFTNLTEDKFSIAITAGALEIKVGDTAAFYNFVLQYFTKPPVGTVATYTMILETRDIYDGCSRFTLNIAVEMGAGSASMLRPGIKPLANILPNEVFGNITVAGAYDCVSPAPATVQAVTDLGLKLTTAGPKAVTLEMNNIRAFNRAIFEGKFTLDTRKSIFIIEPDWVLNLAQGQTATLSTRISFGAGFMTDLSYYNDLTTAIINIDVSEASPSATVLNLALLFPTPSSPSFSYTGLMSGTKSNYTKQSTYVISIDFLPAFFAGRSPVFFTGSFYYNNQTTRRLPYRINFNPKP
jgi:hypothetical protein